MIFKTQQPIKGYKNEDLTYNKGTKENPDIQPLTLEVVINLGLNSEVDNEVISPVDKMKIYGISVALYKSDTIDLTVDDMSFIKERVGKVLPSVVYGRITELFNTIPQN